jgi:hypothetical protein
MLQTPVLWEHVGTMAGVTSVTQPAGEVEIMLHSSGDTVLDVSVSDGDGGSTTVHLDRDMVLHLVMSLATAANRL